MEGHEPNILPRAVVHRAMNAAASPSDPDPASAAKAPERSSRGHRFAGFDGLRGIAILSVIVYHGTLVTRYPYMNLGPLRPLPLAGWTGVDLFFALSGFLITSLLLREEQHEAEAGRAARFSIGRFYLRRIFRILPAFYTVLLLDVFVFSRWSLFASANLAGVHSSPVGVLPFATFWANYAIAYGPRWFGSSVVRPGGAFEVFWSLCVEEHFYLLWPLFLLLVRGTRARVLAGVLVGTALPILRYLAVAKGWDSPLAVHYGSHYRLDSILWGGTAAILAGKLRWSDRGRRLLIALGGVSILALVCTDTMCVVPVGKPLGFSLGFSLLALTSSLLLMELVARPRSWLARALERRPLASIGKVSYGMYLLHLPMMDLGMAVLFAVPRRPTPLNLLLAWVWFALLAYAAAWLLYQLVEKRFLALKARFSPAARR